MHNGSYQSEYGNIMIYHGNFINIYQTLWLKGNIMRTYPLVIWHSYGSYGPFTDYKIDEIPIEKYLKINMLHIYKLQLLKKQGVIGQYTISYPAYHWVNSDISYIQHYIYNISCTPYINCYVIVIFHASATIHFSWTGTAGWKSHGWFGGTPMTLGNLHMTLVAPFPPEFIRQVMRRCLIFVQRFQQTNTSISIHH